MCRTGKEDNTFARGVFDKQNKMIVEMLETGIDVSDWLEVRQANLDLIVSLQAQNGPTTSIQSQTTIPWVPST